MDHAKRMAFVVIDKVAHVFEKKNSWPMMRNDPCHVEKECALRFAGEAMRPIERVLF